MRGDDDGICSARAMTLSETRLELYTADVVYLPLRIYSEEKRNYS
jgi:hypothetical protein